ncbi:MAG TPA: ABC transporter permease [Candidatus Kapabacteria bacterium]|nr:ABC transporter permease [Candidatus Kapabacteria bacterium]
MKTATILKGIYALWYREFKVFTREKSRVISSVFMPLFWYFIFGYGIGSIASVGGGVNYHYFIFPGFLAMTIIFTGLFNGAYVVWDKKIDFLKEVLISPLSRTTIFAGKMLGGSTDALLQACILLVLGLIVGVPFTFAGILLTIATLCIFAAGLVSLGLIIGSFMESPEGYGMVASFAVYPMFLLSGAFYPSDRLPGWLRVLTFIDPGTYAVDGLRSIIIGVSTFSFATDILILLAFDVVFIAIGTWAFNRMKL